MSAVIATLLLAMTVLLKMVRPIVRASAHRHWASVSLGLLVLTTLLASGCAPQTRSRILFTSDRDGNQDIYVVSDRGQDLTRLTIGESNDFEARWSPGYKRILFLSKSSEGTSLLVMDKDGSNPVYRLQLAESDGVISGHRWSPDGSKVSFAITEGDTVELHVMDADGENDSLVAFPCRYGGFNSWSPDSEWIAVASSDSTKPGIFTRNPSGVNQFQLTEAQDSVPLWSPKSDRIAFLSERDGNLEIYVMNGDGTEQTRLTDNAVRDFQVAWAPNGTRLAYVSERDGSPEIYVINIDGTGDVQLTHNDFPDLQPVWSPDGKKIAFVSYQSGDGNIYAMNDDGSNQVRLTTNSAEDSTPYWSAH